MASRHAEYGLDAPKVIRNLLIIGALCLAAAIFPEIKIGKVHVNARYFFLAYASVFMLFAFLMVRYSRSGKYRHRDRMLSMINWTGHEKVLDVGTGRGLMLIGAAKKLDDGIATGIDIFNDADLSGNDIENVRTNVLRENVSHKTVVKKEDARKMSFHDASFDVIFSNLCLHNIPDKKGRRKACKEIARVLKPGGKAVISDFRCIGEYQENFREEGLKVAVKGKYWSDTFPPLTILFIEKPS